MKIILEDGPFSYQVDWAKEPLLEEDELVPVDVCIESFFRLLENIYSEKKIAEGVVGAIDSLDYLSDIQTRSLK